MTLYRGSGDVCVTRSGRATEVRIRLRPHRNNEYTTTLDYRKAREFAYDILRTVDQIVDRQLDEN